MFGLGAALVLLSAWGVWQLIRSPLGPELVRNLLVALLGFAPLPVLGYRIRALQRASYSLHRDGIRLRWGLREVDIPMNTIEWVHPQEDLLTPLPLPWVFLPGAVLGFGRRSLPAAGPVEFMATRIRRLVLIGTPRQVYAISPENPAEFLASFEQAAEYGSLSPLAYRSVQPGSVFSLAWRLRPVRFLLLTGLALSLALLVLTSLVVPGRETISLGFSTDRLPLRPVPAGGLVLLPLLSSFFFLADLLLGLFFYRQEENRPLAYTLWAGAALTPLLFLLAALFILLAA